MSKCILGIPSFYYFSFSLFAILAYLRYPNKSTGDFKESFINYLLPY